MSQAAKRLDRARAWKPALAIASTALLVVATLALRGNSCGHDFDFHLLSWMEAARSWHAGVLYPHWVQDANYGAGEARLVFYPPASWIVGALLGSVGTWAAAPPFFVLLALLASGWSMYRLAREWVSSGPAMVAACLYLANPYTLFAIYERSAFGELLAGVWLPLVLLFAFKKNSSVWALGLAVAAMWLTDAPAAVMASYLLALIALLLLLVERKAWPALRAAGGMACGLGLAAFYVVPAAYEQRWVQVARAVMPGMRVEDSFLFGRTGNALHDQVLHTASWLLLLEIAAAGVAAWLAWRKHIAPGARAVLTSLLPLILFLQLPWSGAVWKYAPKLQYLQFPWRCLLVVNAAGCVLVGMALEPRLEPKNEQGNEPGEKKERASSPSLAGWRGWAAGVMVVLMVLGGARLFFQPCDEEDAVGAQVAGFRAGQGVEGTDEYTLRDTDNSAIQQGLPPVRVLREAQDNLADSSQVENPRWQPDRADSLPATVKVAHWTGEDWRVTVRAGAPGYAVLRLVDYPSWRVTVNGHAVANRLHREDGLMAIPLPAGSNEIDVRWRTSGDAAAGRAISAAALLWLIAVRVLELRRRRSRQL